MLEIDLKIIQHCEQRYDTVGDWWFSSYTLFGEVVWETLHVRVSRMGNEAYEFLVGRHEIDEAFLCRKRGITEKAVTAFDIWYEAERQRENPTCQEEPGDHIAAPYRKEHQFATSQERVMAHELDVDWDLYDDVVNSLVWR